MIEDETWLPIREGRERRDLRAFALVLSARGIDHRIDFKESVWRLLVTSEDLMAGLRELGAYERENVSAPALAAPEYIDHGWWGVAGYLAVIWLVMACEAVSALGWDWRAAGRLHVAAVASGELWRLATALTLHADLGHIFANSAFGGLFGLLAGRYLGSGLGWLCILLGGILGNGLNALVRPEDFSSIGASTATFAALGLTGAFLWRTDYFRRQPWQRGFAPVFAAVAFFAYTGIGDDNTDVMAHVAGLAAGFLLGLAVARYRLQLAGPRAQRFFALAAVAGVASAWMLAG